MFWSILITACVLALAWLIHKGVKGTVFRGKCPCTPYIEHLRCMEKENTPEKRRPKENLW